MPGPTRVIVPEPDMNWMGQWNPETTYPAESVVGYEGSSWVAEIETQGVAPTLGFPWNLVALRGEQGPQGPPGPSGAAGNRPPEYIQSMPATVWVIDHYLGFDPDITVIDSAGTVVLTTIIYTIPGQRAEVHNIQPFSGRAVLA